MSIPEVDSRNRLIAFLQGALKKLNSLTIGNYTFPTSDGTNNQVLTTDGNGTLTFENAGGGGGGISWDGSTANGVATYKDADEATVESNLTFDGSTLTVTGDASITGNTTLGNASGDSVTINAETIVLSNVDTGTDNTVLVYDGSSIVTDEIDSRVWGSTLVDASSGASTRLAVFSDSNTIAGSAELTYDGATFLVSDNAAKLQVLDTDGGNYAITLLPTNGPKVQFGDTDSSDGSFMEIGAYSSINQIDTQARDFHLYGTNTTTGLYFDESAGTFGIGTTAPQVELHISDAGSPQIRLSDPGAGDTQDVVAYTEYYKGDNTTRIGWCGYGSTSNEHFTINNQTATGSFEVKTNNTTAFTVDYQGNATVVGDLYVPADIIHVGDTDTKIGFGSNTQTYTCANSERLKLNSTGVGLMGATPIAGLAVTGDIETSGDLTVAGGNIDGPTDGNLTIGADLSIYLDVDDDNDTSGAGVYCRNGANGTMLMVKEGGGTSIGGFTSATGQRVEFLEGNGGSYDSYNGAYWESSQASNALANTVLTASNQQYDMLGPAWSTTTLYHYAISATPASTAGNVRRATDGSAANNFTGQHNVSPADSQLVENLEDNIGLIVVANGSFKRYDERPSVDAWVTGKEAITIAEALPCVELATTPNDKRAFGVISNRPNEYLIDMETGEYEEDQDGIAKGFGNIQQEQVRINSIGEGAIWVCNVSGNLENGDYITTCEIPGLGMKQDDDLLHNYTVAKITQDCNFRINSSTYTVVEFEYSGSTYRKAFVGCTYHCG